jgi:Xaa-Pro aminopeptidase
MDNEKIKQLAISPDEFKQRIKNIKLKAHSEGIDLILLASDEHFQCDVRYVSDYRPILENAMALIPVDGEPVLLVGPECEYLARASSKIKDIRICSDLAIPGEEYPNTEMQSLESILIETCKNIKLKKVGIAHFERVPNFLAKSINKVFKEVLVIDASAIINNFRSVKSEAEVSIIRYNYQLARKAIEAGFEALKPGMTETDLAAIAAPIFYTGGAEQLSHSFLVASGVNTSPALNFPNGAKIIEETDIVMIDVGSVILGYFSDMGVSRALGKAPKKALDLVKVAEEAKNLAIDKIKPGEFARNVDAAARDYVTSHGYEKNHLYGVCHGVGLQHAEEPFFGQKTDLILQKNMIFTVDIGLFNFGFGGVRQEVGICVTDSGCEIL